VAVVCTVRPVEIFIRPSHISVDPYLRGWAVSNLSAGDLMTSGMVGTVVQSKHAEFREGDRVFAYAHWATITQADPSDRKAQVFKLPDEKNIPPSAYLGCLVTTQGKQGDAADSRSLAGSLSRSLRPFSAQPSDPAVAACMSCSSLTCLCCFALRLLDACAGHARSHCVFRPEIRRALQEGRRRAGAAP
jgi:hypothetical protein